MERTSAKKLAQQRRGRQIVERNALEILQELQQSVSLSILVAVFGHLLQQRFCLHLENSQLVEHGRIEHGIGILLERENPLVLASTYRRPSVNRVLSRDATIFVIAYDAAQQTVVGCRDVVVIVEQNSGKRRGIDTENLLVGNLGCQFGIERMNAFHHEHIIVVHLESLSARLGALRDVELKRNDRHVPDESVEPILSVRDFCIQFEHHGDINVVDHVNFDVRPGQTMGLVGESGCGKSITTLAIMGLTDDDEHLSGEVLWEGRDLLKMSKKEWFGLRGTDIAMVYQDALSSLNPSMLISAQMKQLTKRGGTRSAEELLELVGLDPKRTLESYPHELSGGQRQRVLIAMALTRDPKLVICDEPTTALDVTVQKQVIKLLNDLQAKLGFAMIFVSHDLALVAEVAHNITVMYAGQVIEQAPTKELLTNPIHEYTRGLLGSVLSIESGSGRLHQVPGAVPSPRDFPKGDRFAPRSSHPRIGLDTRPVFKRVPGTEHFYSELPDEVLKANGLTPHAEVM